MAPNGSPEGGTRRIAEYLLTESADSLNIDIVEQARRRIVDTLAATTAGYQFEEMDLLLAFARETFGPGPVSLLNGTEEGLNAVGATLVNSLAANVLDVDDGNRLAQGHPAAIITPAALAAVEEEGGSVGDLIEGFVPAYEVAVRFALAMHDWAGMHVGTGSWGAVAAAAAVARIKGFQIDRAVDALGLAEFNAPITPVMRSVSNPASSMTKDGIGWGGFVGMTAASLADRGLMGSGTVFDGIEHEGVDSGLIESLGERYYLLESYFKPYPACRWIHAGIDAVGELYTAHEFDVADVQEINVYTHRKGSELRIKRPATPSQAEYSYPYIVAAAIRNGGSLTPTDLTWAARSDQEVLSLADRVNLHVSDKAEDRYPEESLSRVEVITDGNRYTSGLIPARGAQERPLPDDELRAKWTTLIDENLGQGTTDQLLKVIESDDLPVGELLAPLTGG